MARRFALAVVAALGLGFGAHGQNSPGTARSEYAPVVLNVACGGLFRSACVKVLPRISARASQSGVVLKPVGSGRTFDTAAAVCDGEAPAAIVQSDALALIGRQPACLGRYEVVGNPLYPYYAFLVVRADAPFRQLDDLASNARRRVMAGAEGTSGQITFGYLLRSNPALQRGIVVMPGDLEYGLQRIADGSVDGFFAVEPLDSDMIDRVRLQRDKQGKPLYTFIDIRPPPEFFHIADGGGHCLYRQAALDFGADDPVTTVSLDSIMVLARGFGQTHARGGPRASDALATAIETARGAILADMNSPPDWRPAGASCK